MVSEGESFPSFFYYEGADSLGSYARGGDCKDHICICLSSVSDEYLFSVQNIVIAYQFSSSLCTAGVGSRIRLCKSEGSYLFALGERNEIFLFLLLCSVSVDRICSQRNVSRQYHSRSAVHSGQFFHGYGVAEYILSRSAVFLRIGKPHKSHLAEIPYLLFRKFVVLIERKSYGLYLFFCPFSDLSTKLLVLL